MNTTTQRFWLSFDPSLQPKPFSLVYELGRNFDLNLTIRNSCLEAELGIIGLEVNGRSNTITEAVDWLEATGIIVEPVELSVIEG